MTNRISCRSMFRRWGQTQECLVIIGEAATKGTFSDAPRNALACSAAPFSGRPNAWAPYTNNDKRATSICLALENPKQNACCYSTLAFFWLDASTLYILRTSSYNLDRNCTTCSSSHVPATPSQRQEIPPQRLAQSELPLRDAQHVNPKGRFAGRPGKVRNHVLQGRGYHRHSPTHPLGHEPLRARPLETQTGRTNRSTPELQVGLSIYGCPRRDGPSCAEPLRCSKEARNAPRRLHVGIVPSLYCSLA